MADLTRNQVVDMCKDLKIWYLMGTVVVTDENCIRRLQSVGVIPYMNESHFLRPLTKNPNHEMRMRKSERMTVKFTYSCNTCRNEKRRHPEIALTTNTWLQRTRSSIAEVIQITFALSTGIKVMRLVDESRIDIKTVVEWYKRCRIACGQAPRPTMIGGPGNVVKVCSFNYDPIDFVLY